MRFFRLRPDRAALIECRLSHLEARMYKMALDTSKLETNEAALLTAVDALLALQIATKEQVAQLASQLAAAGTDAASLQAVQDRLNGLARDLAAEADKVTAVTNPQPAATPVPTEANTPTTA